MNKIFKRKILERIDYFNYIDPDIFYQFDDEKNNTEKYKKSDDTKKRSKEKEYERGDKHLSKKQASDVRKYMQYSNVKSD